MKKHFIKLVVSILFLICLDQVVKLLIYKYFFDTTIEIISNMLMFKPVQNIDMTWFGSLGVPLLDTFLVSVIINFIILICVILSYHYAYFHVEARGKYMQTTFIFLLAGSICGLIDRICWKGSIDFIRLEGFFTFDIKDCYITVFEFLFILSVFRYKELWNQVKIKHFLKYYLPKKK